MVPGTRKIKIKCPTCKTTVAADSADFPFCSERCRLIDLGKWASGQYVVTSPVSDISDELEVPGIKHDED